MEPTATLVQLSIRDLLLVAATLITAIAAFEAGYLRDLKYKIIELKRTKLKNWVGWPNWIRAYRQLWIGFTLLSIAAFFTLAVFFGHSIYAIISWPDGKGWSFFWAVLALLMVVGWFFLMGLAIKIHDYCDPVGPFKDEEVKGKSEGGEPEKSEKEGV